MPTITFTITSAVATRIVDAMKGLEPVPLDSNGDPEFTDAAWGKEKIRRWIKSQVLRWERLDAADTSADAIAEIADGDIT